MISRRGATLLEVLVAIGIVAMLLGLTLPAILKVRSAAVAVKDKNNMRQVAVAMHHYASARGSELPSATDDRREFMLRARNRSRPGRLALTRSSDAGHAWA